MTGIVNSPDRGQSHVVGVVLLLGVAVISMGALTASIGAIVEENAAEADAARVAADVDRALRPVEVTGAHRGRVSFARGELRTVERDLRLLDGNGGVVETVAVDGLVFESGERRVAFVAGAIVRGRSERARLRRPPPITASPGSGGVLVIGAPRLNASETVAVSGRGGVSVALATDVTHRRTRVGNGTYGLAIETRTHEPFERYLRERGATVERRDVDGDGVESVVASFEGERTTYLVVHDLALEVRDG
ncbi:type IV pilin [Halomarina halobia]|uniref:Type IV pilin n=1 Tax=Halomarina halobia TaxID=3033386 RepID=A0ABD6A9Q4_9EURY|nr:type IV pilin [Halomarina sp. PSR21]